MIAVQVANSGAFSDPLEEEAFDFSGAWRPEVMLATEIVPDPRICGGGRNLQFSSESSPHPMAPRDESLYGVVVTDLRGTIPYSIENCIVDPTAFAGAHMTTAPTYGVAIMLMWDFSLIAKGKNERNFQISIVWPIPLDTG